MTVALLFNSCSENGIDDNVVGNYKPADYYVKGKVEKGPFITVLPSTFTNGCSASAKW